MHYWYRLQQSLRPAAAAPVLHQQGFAPPRYSNIRFRESMIRFLPIRHAASRSVCEAGRYGEYVAESTPQMQLINE